MRPVPRAKTLRHALALTQDEFATRFQIPIGTLRDWEQGRVEPDQAAQAYLRAIAGDVAAVQRALEAGPRRSSEPHTLSKGRHGDQRIANQSSREAWLPA